MRRFRLRAARTAPRQLPQSEPEAKGQPQEPQQEVEEAQLAHKEQVKMEAPLGQEPVLEEEEVVVRTMVQSVLQTLVQLVALVVIIISVPAQVLVVLQARVAHWVQSVVEEEEEVEVPHSTKEEMVVQVMLFGYKQLMVRQQALEAVEEAQGASLVHMQIS